jgi:hypothetical protein
MPRVTQKKQPTTEGMLILLSAHNHAWNDKEFDYMTRIYTENLLWMLAEEIREELYFSAVSLRELLRGVRIER